MHIRPKTKRRLIILGVIALAVAGAVVTTVLVQNRRMAHQLALARAAGMAAYRAGDYATALPYLATFCNRSQTIERGAGADFEALFARGRCLQFVPSPPKSAKSQNVMDAATLFERYLRARPDDAPARHALGERYLWLGYAQEAVRVADEALARDPNDADALHGKLAALGLTPNASPADKREIAGKLVDAAPDDLWGWRQWVRLRLEVGAGADSVIDEVRRRHPPNDDDPRYQLKLGATYYEIDAAPPEQTHADAARRAEWSNEARKAFEAAAERATQQFAESPDRPTTTRSSRAGGAPLNADFVRQLVSFMDSYEMFGPSLALLERAAGATDATLAADPQVVRLFAQRLWDAGRYQDVADRLAGVDPAAAASDVRLVGMRALALDQLGAAPREQARAVAAALATRGAADPLAAAWAAALQAHFARPPRGPRDQVTAYQAALAADPNSALLHMLAGEASAALGETEAAVGHWDAAARAAPGWGTPHGLVARVRLAEGQDAEAAGRAALALRRSPVLGARAVFLQARWAIVSKAPRANDLDELFGQADRVQSAWPDDPEVLPLYVTLLSRTGKRDEAVAKLRAAANHVPPLPADTLLRLEAVNRAEGLNAGDALVQQAQRGEAGNPGIALRRALDLLRDGRADDGRAVLDVARQQAQGGSGSADPRWQVADATFREAAGDPGAMRAWVDVADRNPKDLMVQTAALTAEARRRDRAFWRRTIDRVRDLTGADAQLWRIELSRWLLAAPAAGPDADVNAVGRAITMLSELTRQAPSNAEAHRLLGLALAKDNKLPQSAQELTTAIAQRPDDVETTLELVRVLRASGNNKEARAHLDQAAQAATLSPEARLIVASFYEQDGRADKAIAVLTAPAATAAVVAPTTAASVAARGTTRPAAETAAAAATEAARLGKLARLYGRVGRPADAEAIYARLAADPAAAAGDVAAGAEFYALRGNAGRAEAMLNRLATMNLRKGAAEAILGRFRERFGPAAEAESHFLAATRADPTVPEVWRELAGYRLRQNRPAEADAAIDQGLKAVPGNAALTAMRQALATVRAMKRPAEAAGLLDVLTRDPTDPAATALLGAVAAAQNAPPTADATAKALAGIQAVADQYPDFLPAQEQLVLAHLAANDPDKAAAVAARAMQAFPYEPEPARLATVAHARAGKWANVLDAATQWRQRTPAAPVPAELTIAEALLYQNRPAQAAAELEPYVKANPLPTAAAAATRPALVAGATPPDQVLALYRVQARALVQSGRPANAAALLRPALADNPAARAAWLAVAPLHKDEAAVVAWIGEVAPRISADSADERYALAAAWHEAGRALHAAALYRRAADVLRELVARPGGAPVAAWTLLAANAQEIPDYDDAARGWREVLKSGVTDPAVANNLAYVLLGRGRADDLPEALRLAQQAVAAAPTESVFQDTLARVYAKQGNHDAALRSFRAAIESDAGSVEAMIGLADELSRRQSKPETIEAKDLLARVKRLVDAGPPLSAALREQLEVVRAAVEPVGDGGR